MAEFQTSFTFMIHNEDASQAHAIVPDAPPGAHAISGINSVAYPQEFASIAAFPQADRGPAVEQFYQTNFWNQWEGMLSDAVAERVYYAAVNMGPGTAVRLLQQAVNTLGGSLTVDGHWGPTTIKAALQCDQTALVKAFRDVREAHYAAILAAHPEDAKYKEQWYARAGE